MILNTCTSLGRRGSQLYQKVCKAPQLVAPKYLDSHEHGHEASNMLDSVNPKSLYVCMLQDEIIKNAAPHGCMILRTCLDG